ncbi:MAG: anhydro-N-acetylmuramic acid kinase [Alphaproteobacteria bacterium]
MTKRKVYRAIGLMSGTSLDGIDAALIRTDGHDFVETGEFVSVPYKDELRAALRCCLGKKSDESGKLVHIENEMTAAHADAVKMLLKRAKLKPGNIDVIGFHGQTIFHDPDNRFTWQIGDGEILAALTGIDVVNNFRAADVQAGGQGAPIMPLYHSARASELKKPLAILNIGGVANVTYIGANEILAFDTGPGNALLNDWVKSHTGHDYDENGALAAQGRVDEVLVTAWLAHPYFAKKPPKSLDRDAWDLSKLQGERAEDGAATLSAFTVLTVKHALAHLPASPQSWYVTGGGRHNGVLMKGLQQALQAPVHPVEKLGWNGDALEAEGFAWLAVRSSLGEPLSLPSTTGVLKPMTGGTLHSA